MPTVTKRWFLLAMVMACPASLWADGKVFSAVMKPVKIPDQQALIHYFDGVETLVIETRFVGEGDRFAWVVPVPAVPTVSPVTKGLFPTLETLFRPRIVDDVDQFVPAIVALTLTAGVFICGRRRLGVLIFVLSLCVTTVFLPSLARSRSLGKSQMNDVTLHSRQIVGNYEVSIISAESPGGLVHWLEENTFRVDAASRPVIDDYVAQGWVFCAIKLLSTPDQGPRTPHPLAFTFPTAKAVYPLRLTGTHEGPCTIDLYIFGPGRAHADNPAFQLAQCRRTERIPDAGVADLWKKSEIDSIAIVHPQLRSLVAGTPTATKLSGTLDASQMKADAYLDWQPVELAGHWFYTRKAARRLVMNWAVFLMCVLSLIIVAAVRHAKLRLSRAVMFIAVIGGVAVVAGHRVYASLPKTDDEPAHAAAGMNRAFYEDRAVYELVSPQASQPLPADADELRARLVDLLRPDDVRLRDFYKTNNFTGGPREEEDSPGNYEIHQAATGPEYVWYDHDGGNHRVSPKELQAELSAEGVPTTGPSSRPH